MKIDSADLRKRYESLRDDQLIDLKLNGELTETASSVLEEVIAARSISEDLRRDHEIEQTRIGIVTATAPKMWIGYIFAGVYFSYEIIETITDPNSVGKISLGLWVIAIFAWIYWLLCVRRMHQIIAQSTNGRHPVSPFEAVGYHFLPIYNLYWIFKWPNEVANFVNSRVGTKCMPKGWPGLFLLIAMLLGRVDSSFALVGIFTVGIYINRKIQIAVKLMPESIRTASNNAVSPVGP